MVRVAYLDDAVLSGRWVQCILDIALPDDAQVPDNIDGRGPEHVVVGV